MSTAGATVDPFVDEVLAFWLGEQLDDVESVNAHRRMWFKATPADDITIRERFEDDIERAAYGDYAHFADAPRGRLALILLFDQMPRNVFRGTAHAFAFDHLALVQALALIEGGDDLTLHPIERQFAYMPFEHAEDLAMQEISVAKFTALVDSAPPQFEGLMRSYIDYAVQHRDIVARFSRFPHRNALLGRESTPEEAAFLEGGGPTFGQGSGQGRAQPGGEGGKA